MLFLWRKSQLLVLLLFLSSCGGENITPKEPPERDDPLVGQWLLVLEKQSSFSGPPIPVRLLTVLTIKKNGRAILGSDCGHSEFEWDVSEAGKYEFSFIHRSDGCFQNRSHKAFLNVLGDAEKIEVSQDQLLVSNEAGLKNKDFLFQFEPLWETCSDPAPIIGDGDFSPKMIIKLDSERKINQIFSNIYLKRPEFKIVSGAQCLIEGEVSVTAMMNHNTLSTVRCRPGVSSIEFTNK